MNGSRAAHAHTHRVISMSRGHTPKLMCAAWGHGRLTLAIASVCGCLSGGRTELVDGFDGEEAHLSAFLGLKIGRGLIHIRMTPSLYVYHWYSYCTSRI